MQRSTTLRLSYVCFVLQRRATLLVLLSVSVPAKKDGGGDSFPPFAFAFVSRYSAVLPQTKMWTVRCYRMLLFHLLLMILPFGGEAEPVYQLIGKEVQLDPKVAETIRSITWKKENNKLAEWISNKVDYYGRCRTKDQCDLNSTTGVFIMKGLKPEDTGNYFVDLNDQLSAKTFQLAVLGGTAEPVYGLIRKEAELKPEVTETIRSITWKKQKDKIAEWDGSDKPEYYGRCSKDQCDLSPTTGVLVMKGLKREDEWTYSAEINGKTSQEEFLVTVLDPVSKPRVTTSCNKTQCFLVCVGEETKHTKYSWKENGKTTPGNTLTVQESGDRSKSYTCVFSNPKSEEHSDPLTHMDLFPGPPIGAILAGVLFILMMALVGFLAIRWYCLNKTKCFTESNRLCSSLTKLKSIGVNLPEEKRSEFYAEIRKMREILNKLRSTAFWDFLPFRRCSGGKNKENCSSQIENKPQESISLNVTPEAADTQNSCGGHDEEMETLYESLEKLQSYGKNLPKEKRKEFYAEISKMYESLQELKSEKGGKIDKENHDHLAEGENLPEEKRKEFYAEMETLYESLEKLQSYGENLPVEKRKEFYAGISKFYGCLQDIGKNLPEEKRDEFYAEICKMSLVTAELWSYGKNLPEEKRKEFCEEIRKMREILNKLRSTGENLPEEKRDEFYEENEHQL